MSTAHLTQPWNFNYEDSQPAPSTPPEGAGFQPLSATGEETDTFSVVRCPVCLWDFEYLTFGNMCGFCATDKYGDES